MALNSVEYKTLVYHTAWLQIAVKPDLVSLGAELYSTGLTSQLNEIRNSRFSMDKRASDLVQYIQLKVQMDPRNYHTFVDVLREDQLLYGGIRRELQKTYTKFHQHPNGKYLLFIPGLYLYTSFHLGGG